MRKTLAKGAAKFKQGLYGAKSLVDETGLREDLAKVANGISSLAGGALNTVGDAFDTAAGKRMYELVKERLELQDRYNDILALKLDEALKRITQLEAALDARDK